MEHGARRTARRSGSRRAWCCGSGWPLCAGAGFAALGGGIRLASGTSEQRKGEDARQQVLTALRITNHALDQMKNQLAAHDRDRQE